VYRASADTPTYPAATGDPVGPKSYDQGAATDGAVAFSIVSMIGADAPATSPEAVSGAVRV
jgi:hypothetical protein